MKKMLRATATEFIPEVFMEEQYWCIFVIQKLTQPSSFVVIRELKDFVLENGELYSRGNGGVLTRAISKPEAKVRLERIHNRCCGDNDIGLNR